MQLCFYRHWLQNVPLCFFFLHLLSSSPNLNPVKQTHCHRLLCAHVLWLCTICVFALHGSGKHYWLVKECQKTTMPVEKSDKSEDLEGVWFTLKCRNALTAHHSKELTTRCQYGNGIKGSESEDEWKTVFLQGNTTTPLNGNNLQTVERSWDLPAFLANIYSLFLDK